MKRITKQNFELVYSHHYNGLVPKHPFTVTVNVYRNIENGYGLFGVSSVSEVVLEE